MPNHNKHVEYSTQFSFVVPVPSTHIRRARGWLATTQERLKSGPTALKEDDFYHGISPVEMTQDQRNNYITFPVEDSPMLVWFTGSNIDAAIYLTTQLLKETQQSIGIYISWAETCNSPKVNSAGGGGIVVTQDHPPFTVCGLDIIQTLKTLASDLKVVHIF